MTRQKAFITGATSGIGLATARLLARHGFDLVLTGRRQDRLDAAAQEVAALGARAEGLRFDVRDPASLEQARREHPSAFEDVDVLVNNAGMARGTEPVQEADPADWDEMIDTNVRGLLRVTRAILPGMVRRGRGHVVNLGSTAGRWVYPGGTVYCATKHAVRAINEGLRMDLHGTGVRVTTIDPGMVETEFSVVRFRGDEARAGKVYEGFQPLSPDDIAECVLWCVQRPRHVDIQELVVFPTAQSAIRMVARKEG